jgi:molybdenum cofactor guanylyltransferase
VTGVVLAGGLSKRFGSDKMLALHQGIPLVHHAILRLAEVCGDVLVVIGPEGDAPPLPVGAPVRVTRDPQQGEGPLAGLSAGLLQVTTDWALVAAGDMPDLATAVLLEMLGVAFEAPVDAVALRDGEQPRPLPLVIRCDPARQAIHALLHTDERRLRRLLEAMRTAVIDEETWTALDPSRGTLHDVDQPSDLES